MFYLTTPYLYKGIVFLVLLNQFVVFLYQITKYFFFHQTSVLHEVREQPNI